MLIASRRVVLALLITALLITALLSAGLLRAQTAPATTQAATAPVVDEKAAKVLKGVAEFYKSVKSASVTIDTTQKFENGPQKQQRSANVLLTVERPNKLALVVKDDATGGGTVISDGKAIKLFIPQFKRWAEEEAPAAMDDLLDSPVAAIAQQAGDILMLFHSDPMERLMHGAVKISYAGEEELSGVKADHIRVQQPQVDFDFWFTSPAAGSKPTLLRIKPDLTREFQRVAQEQPEMKDAKIDAAIDLKDWKIDQPVAAEQFAFKTPDGVQQAGSLEELFNADEPAFKLKNKPAPEVALDLLAGGKMSLAEHKGKDVVILDLWATWCGPCVEALPTVSEVAKQYASKNVVFYAVNMQEDPPAVQAFLKDHQLDIKVAMDKEGKAGQSLMVNSIPQTVIIGKDGVVKVVHIGVAPNLKQKLMRDLDKVLSGDAAAAPK